MTPTMDGSPASRPGPEEDIQTLERLREGDLEAMTQLVERFQTEMVGFFYNNCWDHLLAEELAQSVFVKVFTARERYQATAQVRTFLYRIAHNVWIDHLRRQRRTVSLDASRDEEGGTLKDLLMAAPSGPDEADVLERAGTIRSRVREALEQLPSGQREVFLLANNHDMKYQEISRILSIPEGTVKSRMFAAIRTLREKLKDLVEP
jgi:RNA polymerase sigma-70 factor (ECF subfamily)